jgi:cell division protein FtsQ
MWDSPRLLNAAANALFVLALALAAHAAYRALMESRAFPLRIIRVEGELNHVARAEILSALEGRVSGNFFGVDLDTVRGLFDGVPWVRRAEVRRRWPDRLEVRLEEQVALARWSQGRDGRLVNIYGELFAGRTDAELPLFAGPAGSEMELTQRYAAFRRLLAPLALAPQQVLVSPRYAWQLKLSNGLSVQLGRDSERDRIADRLARFVSVYAQTLGSFARPLEYVDLRYSNGFALRVPDIRNLESPRPRRQRA